MSKDLIKVVFRPNRLELLTVSQIKCYPSDITWTIRYDDIMTNPFYIVQEVNRWLVLRFTHFTSNDFQINYIYDTDIDHLRLTLFEKFSVEWVELESFGNFEEMIRYS